MSNMYNYVDSDFMGMIIVKKSFLNNGLNDFKIVNINKSFEEIIGINKETIIGNSLIETLGDERRYLLSVFYEVDKNGGEISVDINGYVNVLC